MIEQQIEFDPLAAIGPSYFEVMSNQKLNWPEVIGELIDNGWDARADRITVRFGPGRVVEVADNGEGCDDIIKMLSLGVHYVPQGQKRNRIGRWGVGLKDAATWLWGTTEIYSRSGNQVIQGSINWPLYSKQHERKLKFSKSEADSTDFCGTILVFKNIDKQFPRDFDVFLNELQYLFSPALQQGKQIIIGHSGRKHICSAWKLPPFDGPAVEETFSVNGRSVTLKAGVVAEGHPNERKGYSIFYLDRIIKNTTVWANGDQSLARFCATIELDDKWVLSKNKTDIKETMLDELEPEVYRRCELLIARARKQSENLKNSLFDKEVQNLLQTNLEAKKSDGEKEKREKGNKTGTVIPKHTDIKRKPKKKQPGDKLSRIAAINFDWESANNKLIGRADIEKSKCMVWLNENHSYLQYLRESENAEAIAAMCWVIIAESCQQMDGSQFRLIARGDSVVDSLSRCLIGYDRATKKERLAKA